MTIQTCCPIRQTFRDLGIDAKVVGTKDGLISTRYLLEAGKGVKLEEFNRSSATVGWRLNSSSVSFKPVDGMIEMTVPKKRRPAVEFLPTVRSAVESGLTQTLPLFLGVDEDNEPIVLDAATMPHLLVGGTTGSGKTTALKAIALSVLSWDESLIVIDPKGIDYRGIVDETVDGDRVLECLEYLVDEMERRYAEVRASEQAEYEGGRVVVIIDEYADLKMTIPEVEPLAVRLVQKARAAGIHLVIATQKPIASVINSVIKSNCPTRLCFQVTSASDSRVILDRPGGECLIGNGDLLLLRGGRLTRGQGVKV